MSSAIRICLNSIFLSVAILFTAGLSAVPPTPIPTKHKPTDHHPNGKTSTLVIGGTLFKPFSLSQSLMSSGAKSRQYRQPDLGIIPRQKPTVSSPLLGFCHPLKGSGFLSQGIQSGTHRGRTAYAYDLAVSIGSPVYAMGRGRVIAKEDRYPDIGGGRSKMRKFNYVWIEHEDGYRSAYLHLQQGFGRKVNLTVAARVQKGQLIGYSGNSGWSTAPHLHIEVQEPGGLSTFTNTVPFAMDSEDCRAEKVSAAS